MKEVIYGVMVLSLLLLSGCLAGVRQQVTFEGQAAMELEALARRAVDREIHDPYLPAIIKQNNMMQLDFRPMVKALLDDLAAGVPTANIALAFHLWLVESCFNLLKIMAGQYNEKNILLGGGCFQNKILLELLSEKLENNGFKVYSNEQVPVNDGSIALGQLYVAACAANV